MGFAVVGCVMAVAVTSGCGSSSAASSDGKLTVVASADMWGDIARQVGGEYVDVTSVITDPEADPHDFESNPATAAVLAKAQIVIENGAGYDAFMDKLLSAAGGGKTVLDVARINDLGSDVNPHLWYSPRYVEQAARSFEQTFAKADPEHAGVFARNLATFLTSYGSYQRTIDQIKTAHAGESVAYTEPVPGYLVEAAGLKVGVPAGFAKAVEQDADPSPQDTAAFTNSLKQRTVKVLLYNDQVVDQQTKALQQTATQSGVPVVGVAETLPKGGQDFQTWQTRQAQALLAALDK